jgi:hypothetical protein
MLPTRPAKEAPEINRQSLGHTQWVLMGRVYLASLLFRLSTSQLHISPWTISMLRCRTWSGFSSSICAGFSNNQPHCSISRPLKSYTLRSWARIEHLEAGAAQYLTFAWWSHSTGEAYLCRCCRAGRKRTYASPILDRRSLISFLRNSRR